MTKVVDKVVDGVSNVDNQNNGDIGRRMKAARGALGLTQDGLAKAIGVSKRGIQENEVRNRVPGGDVISGMIKLGINANWLLTGEGPMLLADLAGEKTASCGDSLEVAGAPIPGLIVMDECHPAKAQQINIKALAAILEGALKIAPDAPPEKLAAHTASLYQRCIEEDLITPTGIGPGRMAKAS